MINEVIDEVIKHLRDTIGDSEFERQGYKARLEYEDDFVISSEDDILNSLSYSVESRKLINQLRQLKDGDYLVFDGIIYIPNVVRIKDGWDIHLLKYINKAKEGFEAERLKD